MPPAPLLRAQVQFLLAREQVDSILPLDVDIQNDCPILLEYAGTLQGVV